METIELCGGPLDGRQVEIRSTKDSYSYQTRHNLTIKDHTWTRSKHIEGPRYGESQRTPAGSVKFVYQGFVVKENEE
jgi:hypothetical protein